MNLASISIALQRIITVVAFAFGIIGMVLLIRRVIRFSKCAKKYRAFKIKQNYESVYGKVIYRNTLKNSLLCRNHYEITAVYRVKEKEYQLTELSVGRAYPLDEFVEVEYDVDNPEEARLKDGTDSSKYESCIRKSVAEIVLLAAALIFCRYMINGIFVWIEFIIRFVYELAGGVPYNI